MSFGIYIAGYIILIVGLAIGAHMLHVPQKWIGVGVFCLVGVAIIHGVTATRQKGPDVLESVCDANARLPIRPSDLRF
jgi:hypothetical protein